MAYEVEGVGVSGHWLETLCQPMMNLVEPELPHFKGTML